MFIVLDTTETYSDLRMEGANYTFLRSFISRNPVKLVVPQIVIEETVNHFRESLTSCLAEAGHAIRSVKRLIPNALLSMSGELSIEAECGKYHEHLKKQLFLADQTSYKDVDVASLVHRALARKKPFDSNGKVGFRDSIIWETILLLVKRKPDEILFITRNTKDFCENGQLHKDLLADLVINGLSNVSVTVCEGLSRFIEVYVKPSLEKLDEIQKQINDDRFPGFDATAFFTESRLDIEDALRDQVSVVDLDCIASQSVYNFSDPSLGSVSDSLDRFLVADVWRINEDQLGIGIDYVLQGSIECLQETSYGPYDEPFNQEYSGDVEFKLVMTVIIEEKSGDVISWELNELEVEPTGDWGFPDND